MKYKYEVTIKIESDRALKLVDKDLIQEHRLFAFVETKRNVPYDPYIAINSIEVKSRKVKGE